MLHTLTLGAQRTVAAHSTPSCGYTPATSRSVIQLNSRSNGFLSFCYFSDSAIALMHTMSINSIQWGPWHSLSFQILNKKKNWECNEKAWVREREGAFSLWELNSRNDPHSEDETFDLDTIKQTHRHSFSAPNLTETICLVSVIRSCPNHQLRTPSPRSALFHFQVIHQITARNAFIYLFSGEAGNQNLMWTLVALLESDAQKTGWRNAVFAFPSPDHRYVFSIDASRRYDLVSLGFVQVWQRTRQP